MKYTHLGFSQQVAISMDLDDRDLAILRWFVDFKDSGSMSKKIIDGELYYWVEYEKVVDEYPIFKFKKDTVYRRLKAMSKKGVLIHKTLKQGGVWSYYNLGDRYIELISDTKGNKGFGNKSEGNGYKSEGVGNKSEGNGYKSESNGLKSRTKNPSTISINHNPSTTNPTTTTIGDCSYPNKDIYDYYSKCGFGLLNIMLMEMLDSDIEIYGKEWVKDALTEAVRNGKYKLSYAEGILRNWKADGRKDKEANDNGSTSEDLGTQLRDEGIGFNIDDM